MLDAFIIEELRRRERQREKQSEGNRLQLPVDELPPRRQPRSEQGSERTDGYVDGFEMPTSSNGEPIVIDMG